MAQWTPAKSPAGWANLDLISFLTVQGPDGSGKYHIANSASGGITYEPDFDSAADAQTALDAYAAAQGTVTL